MDQWTLELKSKAPVPFDKVREWSFAEQARRIGQRRNRSISGIRMFYLLEYNRPEGRLVTFKTFADEEQSKADELRFAIELEVHRTKIDYEVILLQAESEAAIRRTHGRYFYDLRQLLERFREGIK